MGEDFPFWDDDYLEYSVATDPGDSDTTNLYFDEDYPVEVSNTINLDSIVTNNSIDYSDAESKLTTLVSSF